MQTDTELADALGTGELYDDRVRPLLLAQAAKRDAAEWNDRDAEQVIAALLANLDANRLRSRDAAVGDDLTADFIAEARLHAKDMPCCIQRDCLNTALDKLERLSTSRPSAAGEEIWQHPDGGRYAYEGTREGKCPETGMWLDGVDYRDIATGKRYWTTELRWVERFNPVIDDGRVLTTAALTSLASRPSAAGEEISLWRDRAFETAAEIVDRYIAAGMCDEQAAKDIRALSTPQQQERGE